MTESWKEFLNRREDYIGREVILDELFGSVIRGQLKAVSTTEGWMISFTCHQLERLERGAWRPWMQTGEICQISARDTEPKFLENGDVQISVLYIGTVIIRPRNKATALMPS